MAARLSGKNRGFIWKDGVFHDNRLDQLVPRNCGPDGFISLLQSVDGNFSLAVERGDFTFAAVDRIRSLPLFYCVQADELLISADAFALYRQIERPLLSQPALNEFLLTGYTSRGETLFCELKQLEAGQCLIWNKLTKVLQIREYYRYTHLYEEIEDPLAAMDRMHERVIGRLIDSAQGRTLVIPLSGGYDSRQIAVMLRRLGYSNVICYTYGSSRHGECVTSRKVAKFLSYPWQIVETNRRMWFKAFHSPEMRDYFLHSTHLASSPHVQDWLAVRTLQERDLIPADAIIVPGHSGGFPQGANLPQLFEDKCEISRRELLSALYHKHFDLWYCPNDLQNRLFGPMITDYLRIPEEMAAETAASLFDEWDWRQRQACFIVNCIRVYDFFGYEWRMPFWDLEFMEFWRRVPLAQRMHRQLYKDYAKKYQALDLPTYHDFPWPQRLANKSVRIKYGELMNPIYGRFLDYRNRHDYINTRIGSLLIPNLSYPEFVNPDLTILRANINAIQSLIYVRDLFTGKLD